MIRDFILDTVVAVILKISGRRWHVLFQHHTRVQPSVTRSIVQHLVRRNNLQLEANIMPRMRGPNSDSIFLYLIPPPNTPLVFTSIAMNLLLSCYSKFGAHRAPLESRLQLYESDRKWYVFSKAHFFDCARTIIPPCPFILACSCYVYECPTHENHKIYMESWGGVLPTWFWSRSSLSNET